MNFKGISVSENIALGKILFINNDFQENLQTKVKEPELEINKLQKALEQANTELNELYEKALQAADEEIANIFMIHSMMLQDEDFTARMFEYIRTQFYTAQNAVSITVKEFSDDLKQSGSDYIAQRESDLTDLKNRLINLIEGKKTEIQLNENDKVILVAKEISPSMTLMFNKDQLLGLVSNKGSYTSHAAILARSFGIPCIICPDIEFSSDINNKECIVDAINGQIYISPSPEEKKNYEEIKKNFIKNTDNLEKYKQKETVCKSGKKILLYANTASLDDINLALEQNCDGIGLFRSEFSYIEKENLPNEEELFNLYKTAAEILKGKKLIIRTLDIGADKQTRAIKMENEKNPALGIRALRLCFSMPDLFITQLRAILRACKNNNISIMFPMVTSLEDIKKAKEFLNEAKNSLKKDNLPYEENPEIGIMIETPAAAIISDLLSKEVDFFSIGTNDLCQYTLAIDRENPNCLEYCNFHHEAILRLIELTCKNAKENGIWCGICGELASDTNLTKRFLNAGIDEFSTDPLSLLKLKKEIIES